MPAVSFESELPVQDRGVPGAGQAEARADWQVAARGPPVQVRMFVYIKAELAKWALFFDPGNVDGNVSEWGKKKST